MRDESKKPLVIYHDDCLDGFCAAMLAWKCLYRDAAEYKAMQYGDDPPDVTGRIVRIVDFSFPREVLLRMRRQSGDLLVFDHHKTAAEDLAGFDWCFFDESKCGSRVFWDWLRSKGLNCGKQENEPWFLPYIEDRDLWRKKIPNSDAITAAIRVRPRTLQAWAELASRWDLMQTLEIEGYAIQRVKDRIIAQAVTSAREMEIAGFTVLVANCPTLDCISELGHALAKGRPFSASYFDTGANRVWSLRSTPEGEDVAEIAKRFGGGGHRHAAGFVVQDCAAGPPQPSAAKQEPTHKRDRERAKCHPAGV